VTAEPTVLRVEQYRRLPGEGPDWWREYATCASLDPDLFHEPETNVRIYPKEAKRACALCPVRDECLWDSLLTDDVEWGYRGGMAPKDREAMLRDLLTTEEYAERRRQRRRRRQDIPGNGDERWAA
jgi:WhiB family redox-sensing transcriptional regulator